jgi:hypothetical protein
MRIPGRIISKPDPCIYSQFLLMQLDQPVTWDNPDVHIFLNGVEQDTRSSVARNCGGRYAVEDSGDAGEFTALRCS